MKQVKVRMEEMFDLVSESHKHSFVDESPYEIPKNTIKVKDEYSNWVSVSHLVRKEDTIRKIEFLSGIISKTAKEHLYFNGDVCILASDINVGDVVKSIYGDEIISKITDLGTEKVYDFTVESDSHLYQTSNGLIHHNTSFIRTLSKLLGMNLIVIEVPHIVEEHIINVPFIIFDPVSDNKESQATTVKMDDDPDDEKHRFNIELADSNLATQIKQKKLVPDDEYLRFIYNEPQNIRDMFEAFGGSENEIPEDFARARKKFHVILFIDEFFRQTSPRIRNMLRTILNGDIGLDKIPEGTYVTYASNLNDEGLEDIPKNTDFVTVNMESPTFEEWVSYLAAKYGIEDDIPEETKKKKDAQKEKDGEDAPAPKRRGRPKGSTNKKKTP